MLILVMIAARGVHIPSRHVLTPSNEFGVGCGDGKIGSTPVLGMRGAWDPARSARRLFDNAVFSASFFALR
jgi:hypothetical protein